MNPLIQLRKAVRVFLVALPCFALLPKAQAVSPVPDGGYPGGNTAEGTNALFSLTTGGYNTGNGWNSLHALSSGSFNTGIGAATLFANTADNNTATGAAALFSNTTGFWNTADGAFALRSNTTGPLNTAIGASALLSNTTGVANTAIGASALIFNTTGNANTAIGANVLRSNTTGISNTAIGDDALSNNTTGGGNTALGFQAGMNHVTGDNNLYVGNPGLDGESNTIRLGAGGTGGSVHTRTFIAAVRGVTTGNNDAIPVLIDSAGQLGTISSSRRFKKEIRPMDRASESILALKPVTFHYKSDNTNRPEFGLIAEQVAEVNPDLVVRDEKGEIYTVRYDAVNAMLLNEFLKEHRKVEEEERTIVELKSGMTALAATVKAQAAQIQKVSAQVELSKPALQTVLNNR